MTLIHNPGAGDGRFSEDNLLALIREAGHSAIYQKMIHYLSDRVAGNPSPAGLKVLRGRELQIEWDGFAIHIDDEVWPTVGSSFPLSSAVIDVKVDDHALEFLVPHESMTKPRGGAL